VIAVEMAGWEAHRLILRDAMIDMQISRDLLELFIGLDEPLPNEGLRARTPLRRAATWIVSVKSSADWKKNPRWAEAIL